MHKIVICDFHACLYAYFSMKIDEVAFSNVFIEKSMVINLAELRNGAAFVGL